MKNIFLIIAFFLVPFFLQADNWELFPFNQKTYYYFQTDDIETIAPYYMDFEEVEDGNVLQYPLRTYIESLGVCYPPPTFWDPKLQLFDFYCKPKNNSQLQTYVRHQFEYVLSGSPSNWEFNWEIVQRDSLFFYPHVSVGDSWEVYTKAFSHEDLPFSHLVVTCISTDLEAIVDNVQDSTKTFQIQAFEDENTINSDFDGKIIKLSKKYGLVEWIPFVEWLSYDLKTHVSIAGFEDTNGMTVGERTPLVEDFFPYEVGDYVKFQEIYWNSDGKVTAIHSDVITNVDRTPNNISYTFNRETTEFTALWDSSIGYTDTIESPTVTKEDLITTYNYFSQHYIDLAYWQIGMDTMYLDTDTIADYTSVPYDFIRLERIANEDCGLAYQLKIEDTTCSTSVPNGNQNECGEGVLCTTEECNFCPSHFFSTNFGLIALRGSGVNPLELLEASIGDCYFTNIESPTYFASQITLHPNPTQNRFVLQLQNPKQQLRNLHLKIADIHGRTLQQLPILQSSIEVDLSEQPNGIYLVQISDGKSWWTEKVVKY